MKKVTLKITGMTCAACSARIEKVVGKMDGVEQISVNLATEKASVSFDPIKKPRNALCLSICSL